MSCDVIGHVTALDQSYQSKLGHKPSIQLTGSAPGGGFPQKGGEKKKIKKKKKKEEGGGLDPTKKEGGAAPPPCTVLNEVHLGNVEDKERPEKNFHSLDSFHPKQHTSSFPAPSKSPRPPSVWRAIVRAFGGYFALGGVFKLCYDLITLILPQILNVLITFIGSKDPLVWRGYAYVAALFIMSCTRTIFDQNYLHVCFVTGMRLRTAIVGVIYRKALRLSTSARRETSVGEIVNLMSVDAQNVSTSSYLSAPALQLGPSVLAGLLVMLLMIPVNAVIAQKTRKLQVKQMKRKDGRIKLMSELLNGIKAVKLYAWEEPFRDRILEKRKNELQVLQTAAFMQAGSAICWFMAPYLVALGSFSVYVLSSPENVLDANKVFVSLTLFNIMKIPMSLLPPTLSYSVQAAVSIGRINKFLRSEELDEDSVSHDQMTEEVLKVDEGVFSWNRSEKPTLININLKVPEGSLVAVVGQVGSGKSSLISALLGEMELVEGHVNVRGSVAYVPQQAWIQNATVKENILFSKGLRESRYQKVIDACALRPDLDILPGGDETEIGENGINLSGGQKQRVSLARAVYQDCQVYLLDDPLSAVDVHVGRHIFDQVVGPNGLLKRKTRLLVTNSVAYLQKMDAIVVLKNGEISEMGTFQELLSNKAAFAEFIVTYLNDPDIYNELDPDPLQELQRQLSGLSDATLSDTSEQMSDPARGSGSDNESTPSPRRRRHKRKSLVKTSTMEDEKTLSTLSSALGRQRLTTDEIVMNGSVKLSVFTCYLRACGYVFWPGIIVWCLLFIASQTTTNIWLSMWSNDKPGPNGTVDTNLRDLRLGVYGGLGALQAVATLGQAFAIAIGCVRASRVLHSRLLHRMLRAPMSFFDTTPTGRIVNRFSKDVDTVDINIPMTIRIWISNSASVIATIIVISYSTPIFLSVVLPLGLFYYFVQRFYICSSRQLKRIDSIRRSPIYAHFGETLTGTSSIRAYGQQEHFIERSDFLVDENQKAYFLSIVCTRWLGVAVDFITSFIVLFTGLFAVLERDTISAGLAGLSVSYALQVTAALKTMVRMTSDMETYIVAVERINEYMELEEEAPKTVENNQLPQGWPLHGRVKFCDYATRYRTGLPLVLRDLNCQINANEKVGIVGRTGAGKSSMTLALFRIIEATAGSIVIDDQVIGKIGLHDLRSKLTIIPQDPVLFTGPLRMNLDPFDRYTDEEVWRSLEHAHLKDYVVSLPSGLQHDCAEGGEQSQV
ncbi:Multidrug resistance-associated protein 1 [Lamellibrachia satsuma]|nr:Multidrug resistance-associated protein 1 [Lamellibrachia satsuma]